VVKAIERLIELDEQETVLHRERSAFLSLTAAILESLPDALIVADADGKIAMVNQMTELMFGYVRSDLIGQPVEMLIPPRLRAPHEELRRKYTRNNINPHVRTMGLGSQLMGVRREGNEFPTDVKLARMVVPHGIFNLALVRYSQTAEVGPAALAASVPDNEITLPNA
jgi:PAS domain S-box-containing protein